ncbi:alpha-L-arabinofuranosidase [Chitinophaga oryziterrae]|uniref:non-reducing end alpha-L-arabinofuranosidase n=1 Tax=Chitinophaga oryziterrae TaxID=1031224 RepID=A0A6N8J9M4_9BACT|nr:alpha-L-arabinofuranosidase C-terminal domain-containing protein [Chitinophaga oryziterrae]MVT41930.1 alpha-L-arabinofuranosidase [Chitinophaga oryziterrae]
MTKITSFVYLLFFSCMSFAQTITVQVSKPQAVVQPTMWGIFFEDINFSADGGLYAELVKNRSFEFTQPLMGWKQADKKGKILIVNRADNKANPRYAHITGEVGLVNEGFRGMGLTQNEQYNFSIWARGNAGVNVALVNEKGEDIGHGSIAVAGNEWKKYTVSLTAVQTVAKGALKVSFSGEADVDMISLFPANTWKQRPGGLRADLVQLLADLHPGFVRFPGGCIVEGRDLANRYQWKNTVGKVEDRTQIVNRWNTEFSHRAPGDYFQSYGLGFFEYFQLAEDIGASPLPILNCGMACQYNTGEVAEDVDSYIQDALDLIEFANGTVDTRWGKLRTDMGHPAPFNLKMMGVGNEQWDSQYVSRYKLFEKALKGKHPEIRLVSSVGPSPDGDRFDYLWSEMKAAHADLVDEHYYMSPDWFLQNARRYDNYDRNAPKIFAGEYAAHVKDKEKDGAETRNTWGSALAEAAFMTGLERNADVVQMASYAPLLAHVDAWQWRPDLIWFDNLRSVGTPNYYVQKLFANNRGVQTVPVLSNGHTLAGEDSLYASATIDPAKRLVFLKVVNASGKPLTYTIRPEGPKGYRIASQQVLTATDKGDFNTLDNPGVVKPVELKKAGDKKGKVVLAPNSLNLFVMSYSL